MTKIKIKVRQWLTRREENNIPMRTMFGEVISETSKAVQVKLHGKPEPSSECLHCGKKLTHPVSLHYGIGPVCGKHFYIKTVSEEELDSYMEEIKLKLAAVTWEGWIPKSQIEKLEEIELEKRYQVGFVYKGKTYRTTTHEDRLTKIKKNAEKINYIIDIMEDVEEAV